MSDSCPLGYLFKNAALGARLPFFKKCPVLVCDNHFSPLDIAKPDSKAFFKLTLNVSKLLYTTCSSHLICDQIFIIFHIIFLIKYAIKS